MNSVSNAQHYSFADFNLKHWPLVIIKCNELKHNDDFDFFLQRWENFAKAKQNYTVILDTRNVSNIGITNVYSGINFMKNLKKQNPQYLKNTIFIYSNSYLYHLFNMVMSFQNPVSKTYTYMTTIDENIDYIELFNRRNSGDNRIKVYG